MNFFKKNILLLGFLVHLNSVFSQQIDIIQNLSFGTFIPSNSISLINISPLGNRTIYGNAIPVGSFNFNPAIFSYTSQKVKPHTIVHILFDTNVSLVSKGQSMSLQLGPTDKTGNMFATLPNQSTEIRMGGTLTINPINQNPSGNYLGVFNITIIQE